MVSMHWKVFQVFYLSHISILNGIAKSESVYLILKHDGKQMKKSYILSIKQNIPIDWKDQQ